jgi:acyl-CoA thioester hydrolase
VKSTTQIRVRYADTDAAGIVHYARYLAFFEVGRTEAMRQLKIPPATIIAFTLQAPVLEATLRYRAPARFDDVLVVTTWISDLTESRFLFAYEVRRLNDDVLIATGETLHASVAAVGEGAAVPNPLRVALQQLVDDLA